MNDQIEVLDGPTTPAEATSDAIPDKMPVRPTPEDRARGRGIKRPHLPEPGIGLAPGTNRPEPAPRRGTRPDVRRHGGPFGPPDRGRRGLPFLLLQANYRLEPDEAVAIILAADTKDLVEAVLASIFAHDRGDDATRTYTNWARSSLLANGIDPAKIPVADLPHVLRQLVATGRAMPRGEFIASESFARARADLLSGGPERG